MVSIDTGDGDGDELQIPEDAARANFDIEEAYGVALKPMGVGDGFGNEPCEEGKDAVLWHFATPDEVEALERGGGEVKSKDTKGSRTKTRFEVDADSAVYNPFGGGGPFDETDNGVLVGIHVCLNDDHMPLSSGWEMDWPLYYRRAGYTLDETVAYRVWRDTDVRADDPKLNDVLNPLEQLGIDQDTDFKKSPPDDGTGGDAGGDTDDGSALDITATQPEPEPDDEADETASLGLEPTEPTQPEPDPEPQQQPSPQPTQQPADVDIAADIEAAIDSALSDVDIDFSGEYTTPEGGQGSFSGTIGEGGDQRPEAERLADVAEREADLSEYTEFSRWCLSGGERSASLCGDVWTELKERGVAPTGGSATDQPDESDDAERGGEQEATGGADSAAESDESADGAGDADDDDRVQAVQPGDDDAADADDTSGLDLAAAAGVATSGDVGAFETDWEHGQDVVLTRPKCIACQELKKNEDIQEGLASGRLVEVTPDHPDYLELVEQMQVETLPALGSYDDKAGEFIRYDDNV